MSEVNNVEGELANMFPPVHDITRGVHDALAEGVSASDIADAIFSGFIGSEPLQAELCADHLRDLAMAEQSKGVKVTI